MSQGKGDKPVLTNETGNLKIKCMKKQTVHIHYRGYFRY